jgi:hypothetical protein
MGSDGYDSRLEDWKAALSLLVEEIGSDGLGDVKGQQLRVELQDVLLQSRSVLELSTEYTRARDELLEELDDGTTGYHKVMMRRR